MEILMLQITAMAAAAAAGVLSGLLYDLLWFFRRIVRAKWLITSLVDLAFWLASAALAFTILMHVNGGEVRLFALAGILLGFLTYRATLRRLVAPILLWLERCGGRVAHRARRAARWGGRAARGVNAKMQRTIRRFGKQGFWRRRRRRVPLVE